MYLMGQEEIDEISRVIKSGRMFRYQDGVRSETDIFESEWAQKIGSPFALALTSGTASLICALASLGIGPGDEVIVPAYTFISTALAPLAVGAVPVLAEIDHTLTIDVKDIEKKITPRTKAIIPVHMCGLPCAMDEIVALSKKYNLRIIEDACQADGGSYKGRRLGTIGDTGSYSFNHFKILSAGEGGMMVTRDQTLYERALIHHDGGCVFFRNDGVKLEAPMFAGLNFRMSEILSAMLRVQLRRLDSILTNLRMEKQFLQANVKLTDDCQFSPVNDKEGDCGVQFVLQFQSEARARKVFGLLSEKSIPGVTMPIDTGRHVYCNWEAVLQKRGAHCDQRNPYKATDCKVSYDREMCPSTLSILSKTVYITLSAARPLKELENLVPQINSSLYSN